MITIRIRTIASFAAGVAVAIAVAAVFVGIRTIAAGTSSDTTFVPVAPCRLFDYRPAPDTVGPRTAPLGPAETMTQQVTGAVGNCNVPAGATAVSMNVTAVGGTAASFLVLFPADLATIPTASNLNWLPGQGATPNKADVKLSPTGAIKLFNAFGSVNVLADVTGYYTNSGLDALRNQTVTFSGFDLTPQGGLSPVLSTQNGCVNLYNDSIGYLPIAIPLGASITAVTAHSYAATSGAYSLTLFRQAFGPTGLGLTSLAQATVSGASGGRTTDLTPATAETVDVGEAFLLRLDDGIATPAGFGNGAICDVVVSYRLAG